MNHAIKRNIVRWGSCGKFHNEQTKYRTVAELSDSHLLKIIEWIEIHLDQYGLEIFMTMKEEARFRTVNYIFVPDYES